MPASAQRSFPCPSCKSLIYIPHDLPPTTANCPHCQVSVTSPAPFYSSPPSAPEPQPPAPAEPVALSKPTLPFPEVVVAAPPPSAQTMWWLSGLLLLGIMAGGTYFYLTFVKPAQVSGQVDLPAPKAKSDYLSPLSWRAEAMDVLERFLTAKTPQEKARYVIGGQNTVARLQAYWGQQLYQETAVDAHDFAAIFTGNEEGELPVYLLMYDRPVQYDMKTFFRPLVSMEVIQGVERLDPLTKTLTEPQHFEQEALKIGAYFKPGDDGLRLDYDLYLQTRYRTLHAFAESAAVNSLGTFRVVMVEDVPLADEKRKQLRVYRITDPMHLDDSFRVCTSYQSDVAQRLQEIHWYGTIGKKADFAAATVTIRKITQDTLLLESLVCWDFEGLAGEPGNTLPRYPGIRRALPAPETSEDPATSTPDH